MQVSTMCRRTLMLLVVVAIASVGGFRVTTAAHDSPEITATITATDFAYDIPDTVEAGYVTFTLVNDGAEDHHAQILRLNEGTDLEGLLQAFDERGEAAIAEHGSFVGGPGLTSPGHESSSIVRLDAGSYVAICFVPSPDGSLHLEKGMVREFTVTGEVDGHEPEADVTAALTDFGFEAPSEVPAGEQTWEVVNGGPQPHEIQFVRLDEGVTFDQFLEGLSAQAVPASPGAGHGDAHGGAEVSTPLAAVDPPFTSVGGVQALDVGATGWFAADLAPGTYAIVCYIPDVVSGTPHYALGMVQELTVTG